MFLHQRLGPLAPARPLVVAYRSEAVAEAGERGEARVDDGNAGGRAGSAAT